jgi:signal peptidase II
MRQKRKTSSGELRVSILVFSLLLFFDQLTKWLVRKNLVLGSSIDIGSILSLTYVRNTGVSFGLFKGYNFIFTIIAAIALLAFIYFFLKRPDFRLAFVIAGISGNLIDRLTLGYVVDFINFHFWPIFNIADSSIFTGIMLLLIQDMRRKEPAKLHKKR